MDILKSCFIIIIVVFENRYVRRAILRIFIGTMNKKTWQLR